VFTVNVHQLDLEVADTVLVCSGGNISSRKLVQEASQLIAYKDGV
jgi:hypothetical protein